MKEFMVESQIISWSGSSHSPNQERSVQVLSPFHGGPLARVHLSPALEAVKALATAKKMSEAWGQTSIPERLLLLRRLHQELSQSRDEFAVLIAEYEGLSASFALRRLIQPMERLLEQTILQMESTSSSSRRPTGVLALIIPAVASFRVLGERLIPALAAGNVVVAKLSPRGPVALPIWSRLLERAGFPVGVVSLLVGEGQEVGDLLARHPSVDGLSFAGRPETARRVLASSVQMGKKIQVSGGVKNSLLLHSEYDFSNQEILFESLLVGSGRWPWSLSQVYVPESRLEELEERIRSYVNSLRPLQDVHGMSPWTPVMPGFDSSGWSALRSQIDRDHGKVTAGGDSERLPFVRPLFVRDLTHCSVLQMEELTFPLILINPVKYLHEMAKWVNTIDYGFCASIWGPSEKAARLGEKLDVSEVWINDWMIKDAGFAGSKKSFFGHSDFDWRGDFFSGDKKMTVV